MLDMEVKNRMNAKYCPKGVWCNYNDHFAQLSLQSR